MKTLIKNGRIIDPATNYDQVADLYIQDQYIVDRIENGERSDKTLSDFTPDHTIDASDKWVLPGIIDLAATLREPGQDHKATIKSETKTAAYSGITRLCCMPETNNPIDSMAIVNLIRERCKASHYSKIEIIGAMTAQLKGNQLSNMGGLKHAECIGVTNNREPLADTRILRMAMDYASSFELPLFLHPVDHSLQGGGVAHEGEISTRMGLPGIPVATETSAMSTIFSLMEQTGAQVHLCRLSSASSVRMVEIAQANGLALTADVAAHQLFLTEIDISDFNPLCHVQPPLRTQQDKEALRQAVADGTIQAICSDHQPHDIDAKLAPFQQTEPGISALETLLPLTLRLVEDDVLTLNQAIRCLTQNPANIIGKDNIGSLQKGNLADIAIYDPNDLLEINRNTMMSQGKNTPFTGWNFNGRVVDTLIHGQSIQLSNENKQ